MSTTELAPAPSQRPADAAQRGVSLEWETVRRLLKPLASLRLTVALFGLSIVLVLAGTLAQIDVDVWYVVHNYFRTFVAWIDLQVFFPRAWHVPGVIPFPGGWLLGSVLGVNLLAAHAVRFKVTGSGRSLWTGVALIAVGAVLTYAVIRSGLGNTVESELSPAFCHGLWHALRAALGGGALVLAYVLALSYRGSRGTPAHWLWWLTAVVAALLGALTIWLFTHPEAQLDPSGLRILWQLIKGSAAALVLLAGCYLVFGRRAGIVLLHGGIGLMMFGELFTGLHAQEGQMQITEGQTVRFSEDIRSAELAIIDQSDPRQDHVTIIPAGILKKVFQTKELIEDPALPFALRVVEYIPNAVTRLRQPGEESLATQGHGVLQLAEPRPISTGVGNAQGVDLPAVYVLLLAQDDHTSLGTYLLPLRRWQESLSIGGKPYAMELRFKRIQKPYAVKLLDFQHDLYVGTNTPKNFASLVELTDPARHVDRKFKIWMNNPLRYAGDTLYQSGFDEDNPQLTILQVVTNSGWMIPYVACMLVATGMLAHFGSTLFRFAQRQAGSTQAAASMTAGELLANWRAPAVWVPALLLLVFAGWVGSRARPATLPPTEMQIQHFGQLPVAYDGRVKPMDTLARNALTILSGREKVSSAGTTLPAIQWLLDVLTNAPAARDHRMIRIDNLDVLESLGLQPRAGFRYSMTELFGHEKEYLKQISLASQVPAAQRTLPQQKIMELGNKISLLNILRGSFSSPSFRSDSREHLREDMLAIDRTIQSLNQRAPRAVPPATPEGAWQTLLEAERDALFARAQNKEVNAATPALRAVLDAYLAGDVLAFNNKLDAYQGIVSRRAEAEQSYFAKLETEGGVGERKPAERLNLARIRFEAYFNHFNPFLLAMALYLAAFLLAAGSWLGWTTLFNRAANWLLWFTFALHTFALVARIYISGRPPVTNLYSSAVFIGWGAVLFALVFEKIYRLGIGNLLAAAIGFPTLFIAYNLAGDGDTFQVLQAVLDTQFWLATHVVCITLGYATTLLAGVLGLLYLLLGHVAGRLDENARKQLVRMIYGTICFAIFFSFVGTVLGGLWADDSWGRFWGWDPKENGALIIVLWNALVLHARWGGIVARRGLAVLAVFGNVVTAWSWFGVNAMGIGLHAYGFRSGMIFWMLVFVASQLAVMALGWLPETIWRRRQDGGVSAANA